MCALALPDNICRLLVAQVIPCQCVSVLACQSASFAAFLLAHVLPVADCLTEVVPAGAVLGERSAAKVGHKGRHAVVKQSPFML